MSRIEMSAGFMAGLPQRIIRLGEVPDSNNVGYDLAYSKMSSFFQGSVGILPSGSSGNYTQGIIQIFKGTAPSNFDTLVNYDSRSQDRLVVFTANGGDFGDTTQTNKNPSVISTAYREANASGVASWFRLASMSTSNYAGYGLACGPQIIGSVGLIGSGADLEIPNVNLVQGESYRVRNLRIRFPSYWDY